MTASKKRLKIYEIYGYPGGMISKRSVHYYGSLMAVAAYSSRQAMYLAGNDIWATHLDDTGIVSHYVREHGERLWCCEDYSHPSIIRAQATFPQLRRTMVRHLEEKH